MRENDKYCEVCRNFLLVWGSAVFYTMLKLLLSFPHVRTVTVGHILGLQARIGPLRDINGLKVLPKQFNGVVLTVLQQPSSIIGCKRNDGAVVQIID